MALFEGYERRVDKINSVLAEYGISSIEECKEKGRLPSINLPGFLREAKRITDSVSKRSD